ncbi:MAG: HU family DNA-binding protein [Butyricicoccus pullicaecorum]|nr:HU family DNA-binding protein [Butyricicoccus pullicaecorum]MBS5149417.1 HU family DNA-binding protein [Butyricicoccus pullicaecorum]MDO4669055.1 HU family DNA-binding protein [Butyricicoccus pullicaecorum]
MNKAELITCVAERTGITKKDTEKTINVMLDILSELLAEGDKVNLSGFGAFETRMRAARTCRNIHTGEPISVDAARTPVFKPAKSLKERVENASR